MRRWAMSFAAGLVGAAAAAVMREPVPRWAGIATSAAELSLETGENPHPVRLIRPAAAPLSAMAELGRLVFFDASLSSSGGLACASCHSPEHAYGPPSDAPAMMGGPSLSRQGVRAVPSLMYLERQPNFGIGPDDQENESISRPQPVNFGQRALRARKSARDTTASAANLVPQGGLFWDGRADTLQQQALAPLLSPLEMDATSVAAVAAKLRQSPYAARFLQLFGASVFDAPPLAAAEALFAVGRYQIEDPSFHPYASKYDFWLEGRARLDRSELRGYVSFNDPDKANCGGCHLDLPSPDGLPPLFTDHQFEALGVPRNPALAANRDPGYYDLGLCGPVRADLHDQRQYCGLFMTPTLRNVATRRVFFHNGVDHSLQQVLDFYDFRDTQPQKVYPRRPEGSVARFDDMPPRYRANIDETDAPFGRKLGQAPAMSPEDERNIIAFLKALTDGYQPRSGPGD